MSDRPEGDHSDHHGPARRGTGGGFLRFLATLAIPFLLLGIGAVLIAGGVIALVAGGHQFLWIGLMIAGGVFALAGVIGFLVLAMMAEAGPL